MFSLTSLPDVCSAEDAQSLIGTLAAELGIYEEPPDIRTLRLWRTKKLITIEGRQFTRRNLLEIFAALKLREDGFTQQSAFQRVVVLEEDRLMSLLVGLADLPIVRPDVEPLITLQLLAKGILEQYQRVRRGAVVGLTGVHLTTNETTPLALHQAMARLGRHFLAEGQEDRASSIHQLLALCGTPLIRWAPKAIGNLKRYQNAVLIDLNYYVPNEDCEAIAEEADGANLTDLVEHHLHEELRHRLQKLGSDADRAYTTVREFVGRHPMATAGELQQLYSNPELNDEVILFVRNDLYSSVHADASSRGRVQRCWHCKSLIDAKGCTLAGCRDDYATKEIEPIPLNEAYLARPEVLKYWVDPAREELRLYDALRKVRQLRDRVELYPHSDWCDVAIGEGIGIDVKDYHDPIRLAHRLNRPLGNLSHYPERILAIAKRRWSPLYRDQLIEQLSSERRSALQVMSVDQAIAYVKNAKKGSFHA